jgi:hypothetical protein
MIKPFDESKVNSNELVRHFDVNVDESELKWHWDEEDRDVEPLNENDWFFQFDNELPIPINKKIHIPAGIIHRVIKGSTDLKVKIKKYYGVRSNF